MITRTPRRAYTPVPVEDAARKRPAIVVPVKNRAAYLEVFLDLVPRYLREVNGISDFKIFVAEQDDDDPFNASLARNVGALCALDEGHFDYLIFHDVDLIPVANVDYGYREKNVSWFMNAGTCKLQIPAFRDANGYNPSLFGWSSQDYELYSRIVDFGHPMENWCQLSESKSAVIVNLDLEPLSYDSCLAHSRSYFSYDEDGPMHISYNLTEHVRPKSQVPKRGGWWIEGWRTERLSNRHREIVKFLVSMPPSMKRQYASYYGLNWINRDKVTVVTNTEQYCHVLYRWFDVID